MKARYCFIILFFNLVSMNIYAQYLHPDKIEIVENYNEYYVNNELVNFVSIEIRNNSDKKFLLWLTEENTNNLSKKDLIVEHFFKTKGDFSLIQIAGETGSTLNLATLDLFLSFVKIIEPNSIFRIIISLDKSSYSNKNQFISIKKFLIFMEEKELEEYFKVSIFENINYESNILFIPSKLISKNINNIDL